MRHIPLGVHLPGDTAIHRLPAGVKFLALLAFILTSTFLVTRTPVAAAWCAVVLAGYVVARVPVRVALGQVLPVVPVLAVLGAFQWWQRGWEFALTTVLVLLASVAAIAVAVAVGSFRFLGVA